jgi:uncharacterized protein YigE (DUF2233 family)
LRAETSFIPIQGFTDNVSFSEKGRDRSLKEAIFAGSSIVNSPPSSCTYITLPDMTFRFFPSFILLLTLLFNAVVKAQTYTTYISHPTKIKMYWRDNIGQNWGGFEPLVKAHPAIKFAMNGGMYTTSYAPVGLYIEEGKQLTPLKRSNNPKVNFGIQPQGVFCIRNGKAEVVAVNNFQANGVRFATQSAPLLLQNGVINPNLPKGNSRHIRNGVAILKDGRVLMAISQQEVTFLEFAQFFKDQGCTNALFLDGVVSESYTKGQPMTYGWFGVIITAE